MMARRPHGKNRCACKWWKFRGNAREADKAADRRMMAKDGR